MKHTDIQKLEAGPELDSLILKEIFGLDPIEGDDVPDYSVNLCDALDVAFLLSGSEDWDEHPFDLVRNYAFSNMWTAAFNDYQIIADADTPALAICRAALMVVMEDE